MKEVQFNSDSVAIVSGGVEFKSQEDFYVPIDQKPRYTDTISSSSEPPQTLDCCDRLLIVAKALCRCISYPFRIVGSCLCTSLKALCKTLSKCIAYLCRSETQDIKETPKETDNTLRRLMNNPQEVSEEFTLGPCMFMGSFIEEFLASPQELLSLLDTFSQECQQERYSGIDEKLTGVLLELRATLAQNPEDWKQALTDSLTPLLKANLRIGDDEISQLFLEATEDLSSEDS
jgi:hypothetical protein